MILQTIKQILCLLCLCCFLQQSAFSQDDKNKPAYTLFDNTGKQISYGELIKRLSGYDVIFLGELHNCPITHWLEFEITRSIYNIHKDQLMLGAEMFESDNQLIFDEYMQQKISYDRFEAEARLWIITGLTIIRLFSLPKNITFRSLQPISRDATPTL